MTDILIKPAHDNVAWIFLCSSQETRHLYNIVYAVHCLRNKGFLDNRFFYFIDHAQYVQELTPFGIVNNIFQVKDFQAKCSSIGNYETVILTITGHGMESGIQSCKEVLQDQPYDFKKEEKFFKILCHLKPQQILDSVFLVPSIKNIALIMCQCYAGIFDHLKVPPDLQLCSIGSTKLNKSLSLKLALNNAILANDGSGRTLKEWQMAVFMIHFYMWVASTDGDIDGDGNKCLIDGFKHSGTVSNRQLENVKSQSHLALDEVKSTFKKAKDNLFKKLEKKKTIDAKPNKSRGDLNNIKRLDTEINSVWIDFSTSKAELDKNLEALYTSVEPWLRSENLARRFKF